MRTLSMSPRRARRRLDAFGITMIEMLIAAAILSIMVASLTTVQRLVTRQTVKVRDQVYASQKALQMMDELRTLVQIGETQGINVLDDYDQGNTLFDPSGAQSVSIKTNSFSPVLTTMKSVTFAGSDVSLNRETGNPNEWRYLRNVYIRTPEGEVDKNVRLVTVRVFYSQDVDGRHSPRPLAEVTGVLRSLGEKLVPSQAYDIYVLGIYGVPGWWVNVGKLQTTFREVVGDISSRNMGFAPRVHYITKMAYGRDPEYAPFINGPLNDEDSDRGFLTNNTAMPYIYFYPGHMTVDNNEDFLFYWSNLFKSDGAQVRIANNSATQLVNDVTGNPAYPERYSLADQFNHAARYPDEMRLYHEAMTIARAQFPNDPSKWPEPSLRMLLEWMNSTPEKFKNALLINLGGEMLPIPTIRNTSDAAKWPDGVIARFEKPNGAGSSVTYTLTSGVTFISTPSTTSDASYYYDGSVALQDYRVVTHSEQLQYPASLTSSFNPSTTPVLPVTLRVYPYLIPAEHYPPGTTLPVVSVYLPFDRVTASAVTIMKIYGRALDNNYPSGYTAGVTYGSFTAQLDRDYAVTQVNGGTLIRLFNTPMRHVAFQPRVGSTYYNRGLPQSARADSELEYMPCPLQTASPYTVFSAADLTTLTKTSSAGSYNKPVNTARWVISLKLSTSPLVNPHVIETRLGDPFIWGGGTLTADGAAPLSIQYISGADEPVTSAATYDAAWNPTVAQAPVSTFTMGVSFGLQNLSRTYVWVGQQAPRTEQFQMFGPPQFTPYADVVYFEGYNWFWKGLDQSLYPGFDKAVTFGFGGVTMQGWTGPDAVSEALEFDYARACQLFREGLLRTTAIWSTLNGYPFWPFGLGGEIGAENQAPTTKGIQMIARPWQPTNNGVTAINEISATTDGYPGHGNFKGRRVITQNGSVSRNGTAVTWHARYWLGELFPDWAYANYWSKNASSIDGGGNLPSGNNASYFYRAPYNNYLGRNTSSLAHDSGPVQFYNATTIVGATNHWFRPAVDSGTTLTSLGASLGSLFNFPMPIELTGPTRPFRLASTDEAPNVWKDASIAAQRTLVDVPSIGGKSRYFYEPTNGSMVGNYHTSGTVRFKKTLNLPSGSVSSCYYTAFNGLPVEGTAGTGLLAKIVLITMLRAYFDAGLYATPDVHIAQLPRVNMTFPGVGDSIQTTNAVQVDWNTSYLKWDGKPYTEEYPTPNITPGSTPSYAESVTLVHALKYRRASDSGWRWAQDGTATYAGEPPEAGSTHEIASTGVSVTYFWDAAFLNLEDDQYYLMVETYRNGYPLHYSFDTSKFTMKK